MSDLPDQILKRVDSRIRVLAADPYRRGTKKLAGGTGFRTAVGSYRILYTVSESEKLVEIVAVRHRREAYR